MASFRDMKRNREKMFKKLNKQIEQEGSNNRKDDRIWYPAVDQAGNGFAEIRFLPAPGDEPVPYVKLYNHGFKGPTGKWYIENSLTTLGKDDPVSEDNQRLWNVDDPEEKRRNQALIRGSKKNPGRKRNLNYFANIYVVKDPANPENEGKVFLFRYGKKIHDKLMEAMQPDELDPDAQLINPFDLFGPDGDQPGGANFKLKINKNSDGFRSYDKSTFTEPKALSDDEDEMEEIWKKTYSLQDLIAPDKFKSYDELLKHYNAVVGNTTRVAKPSDDEVEDMPEPKATRKPRRKQEEETAPWDDDEEDQETETKSSKSKDEDEEDMEYFAKLAAGEDD